MIAENVKNIRQRIKSACMRVGRKPEDVKLIAVTKTLESAVISEVIKEGIHDIGENYVQEIKRKREEVPDDRIRWHFIGHLQSNKIKYIAGWIHLIQTVDSLELGSQLSKRAGTLNCKLNVLVEIKTTKEEGKFGVPIDFAPKLMKDLAILPNLNINGLMTMGPFSIDPEESRLSFRTLRLLKESLEQDGFSLPILSMGMTNDFEIAIEEGSTMLRIGTAIFGKRT